MNRRSFMKYVVSTSTAVVATHYSDSFAGLNCDQLSSGFQFCRAGIDSTVALRMARRQQQSQWCWAACIQMIFAYNDFSMSQSDIVRSTWGSVGNMPATDMQIMNDLNSAWTDSNGQTFTTQSERVFSPQAAVELANNYPLIICTTGHAMVLTALDYIVNPFTTAGDVKRAFVRDPWGNNGRRVLTSQEWYNQNLLLAVRCSSE